MKAVILAAGKGTRMKHITQSIPKPMVLVQGRPMLEHIVAGIAQAGVTDIGLVVGYMQHKVRAHFGDGSGFGVRITYIEQAEQNGTGGALHCAREYAEGSPVFFTFGDILTPASNYAGMIREYTTAGCDAVLALNVVDDPWKGAAVYLDAANTIVRMVEKPPKGTSTTDLINAGIMVLPPDVFTYTVRLTPSPRGELELTDIFGMLSGDGRSLKGYVLEGAWRDVGTPEDLEAANTPD